MMQKYNPLQINTSSPYGALFEVIV